NLTSAERGLQFGRDGLMVTLPVPVTSAELHAGTFGSDVVINTQGIDGTTIANTTLKNQGKFVDISLAAAVPIAALKFTGGNNEGIIGTICTTIALDPKR